MNTPDLFKGCGGQSLDELLNSLIVLKDPEDPENRENQEFVMSVGPVDGVIHAQYVHNGAYIEKPVGFFYRLSGIEHTFSLSDKYERVPIREGGVVIPLSVIEEADLPLNGVKESSLEKRVVHPLGVRIDNSVLLLWIYDKKKSEPLILLVDDPDVSYLNWLEAELKRTIEEAVEHMQSARRRHQFSELRHGINELVRAYVLPIAGVGISLALFGNVVAHGVRINYTEQPEPSRIRSAISVLPQKFLEQELKLLEPYSCLPVQFRSLDNDEFQFKGNFHEKSIVFYETLRARGYFPVPYAMRDLRVLNRGKNYELDIVEGNNRSTLVYTAEDLKQSFQSGFLLLERVANQNSLNLFVMDRDGVINYFITLNQEDSSCVALKPHQLIYKTWLQGDYQWEDLRFAQMQKKLARDLEKIARNPNRDLLRPVN